jgi:hypothetical protein
MIRGPRVDLQAVPAPDTAPPPFTPRRPRNDDDLRFWLTTMLVDHRYRIEEIALATGLPMDEIEASIARLGIDADARPGGGPSLRIRPYPGGRAPHIALGVTHVQRETKVSVFTPWDPESYVVVDMPEGIWTSPGLASRWDGELLYLAHRDTYQPLWNPDDPPEPIEWRIPSDDVLTVEQRLPSGVDFGATVRAEASAVRMEIWLHNGTERPLTDLSLQICAMLKGANGFQGAVGYNRVADSPYVAVPIEPAGDRWVITAWEPVLMMFTTSECPCIHSDPSLPDCAPGETVRSRGWLSFFEGRDVRAEMARIDALEWWNDPVT